MLGFPKYLQLQLLAATTLLLLQGQPARAFLSSTAARKSMLQQKGSNHATASSSTALPDEVVRNGEEEPIVEKSDRDELVQNLQTEVASLRAALTDQKESYDVSLQKLRQDSDEQVQLARDQLSQVRVEFSELKDDTAVKLEQAASPEEIDALQAKVGDLKELKDSIKGKLDDALSKLKENLEDRKNLQVEMVLMKQGYLDKLSDVEDELEGAQDARVRDQQESAKKFEDFQGKSSKALRDAIDEGRKQAEDLTLDYTRRIAVKDEELSSVRDALGVSRTTIVEKEAVISQLEDEASSLRKLMKKSYQLIRGRVSKRLSSLVPRKLRRKR
jgi:chromosome segregation ATPase